MYEISTPAPPHAHADLTLGRLLIALQQQSQEVTVVCDRRGLIVGWNTAAEEFTGTPAEEMIGRDPDGIVPRQQRQQLRRLISRALRSESGGTLHYTQVRNGETGKRLELTVTPILEEQAAAGALIQIGEASELGIDRQRIQELELLAAQDPLTGLPNRRTFDVRLPLEMARSAREGHALTLALMDIDRFKSVNDDYGHQAGDRVLRRVGQLLGAQVRFGEVLARVGGEEFAWILRGADADGAMVAVERVRSGVRGESFPDMPGRGPVTMSVGICVLKPGMSEHALYGAADNALLTAKRTGRDRVVIAGTEGDQPPGDEHSDAEHDLPVQVTSDHGGEAVPGS